MPMSWRTMMRPPSEATPSFFSVFFFLTRRRPRPFALYQASWLVSRGHTCLILLGLSSGLMNLHLAPFGSPICDNSACDWPRFTSRPSRLVLPESRMMARCDSTWPRLTFGLLGYRVVRFPATCPRTKTILWPPLCPRSELMAQVRTSASL